MDGGEVVEVSADEVVGVAGGELGESCGEEDATGLEPHRIRPLARAAVASSRWVGQAGPWRGGPVARTESQRDERQPARIDIILCERRLGPDGLNTAKFSEYFSSGSWKKLPTVMGLSAANGHAT